MSPKPNLDLLRAMAITFVVVGHTTLSQGVERYHTWWVGDVGLFGVYLFFVHTSLVLMWSLERRPDPLDFYIRRVFRIYPLALLAVTIAAFTHAPVAGAPYHYFRAVPFDDRLFLWNLTLVQDLGEHRQSIHGVTWSLGPELSMYVLLPCLFYYAHKLRQLCPLLVVWCLTAIYLRGMYHGLIGNPFPILIPDFLGGVIAYVGFRQRKPVMPSWTLFPLIALLFGIYMSLHGHRADWYVCLMLALMLPYIKQAKSRPINLVAHQVATYSYGIYLFHPFTIVFGMLLLNSYPFAVQVLAMLLPLALLASAGYHFIEAPMIRYGTWFAGWAAGEHQLRSRTSHEDLEPAP